MFEHLNKKQKVSFSALDALDVVDMLMFSHAKTIKSFSLRQQLIAKKKIAEIIADLEMKQIEGNEKSHCYHHHTDSCLRSEIKHNQNSKVYYCTTHTGAQPSKNVGSRCPQYGPSKVWPNSELGILYTTPIDIYTDNN